MEKLLFFDLETTGVKHWRNGVHQISGCIEVDGKLQEDFNFRVQPNPACDIEDEALKIGGVTREQVIAYPAMKLVHREIGIMLEKYVDKFDKTDKFHLVGYNNASFDNQFFRAFFTQCGDSYFGSWFWSSSIDVMVLAAERLKKVRHEMVDFKLHTVAKQFGITVDPAKLHDARYDITLTREIYQLCKTL